MYYTKKSIITPKEIIVNQTRKYLVQQLITYGVEFMANLRKNNILVYAIQDYGINKTEGSRKIEPFVYMLFDVNGHKKYGNYLNVHNSRNEFAKSLQFFQKHSSYITDYCYDSNKTGHYHVVVVKLPFVEKFHYFMKGEYSKMYSEQEIDQWFIKNIVKKENKKEVSYLTDQYSVLSHNSDYYEIFKQQVYEEFGTILDGDKTVEYDFPPHFNNEILRYNL